MRLTSVTFVARFAPPGYDLGRDDHGRPLVFRVLKAIYGLKQSPACWYKLISR